MLPRSLPSADRSVERTLLFLPSGDITAGAVAGGSPGPGAAARPGRAVPTDRPVPQMAALLPPHPKPGLARVSSGPPTARTPTIPRGRNLALILRAGE